MGIDLNSLFGNSSDAANSGMNDLLKAGANAGLGFLEQKAVDVLSADQAQHAADFQTAVVGAMNQPSTPGSFGTYLSGLVQGPAVQKYGPYAIAGFVAIIAVTIFLSRGSK